MAMALENTECIKVTEEKFKYTNTEFKKVSATMYDFKCDVKLAVGKQTFRAHREVLSEASDYFVAMFGHDFGEKDQKAIEFHEISPQGFTCMLEYFYHGHITIEADSCEDILEAARFFMIDWLVQVCCDFLVRHMSLDNYNSVLALADKYVLGDLRTDIFRFIGQNFVSLSESPRFPALSLDLFKIILSEDYFIHATEDQILRSVLRWFRHDAARSEVRAELLRLIRWPLIELDGLENMPQDVLEIDEIRALVDDATTYQRHPSRQCLMTSPTTEARGGREVLMLISAVEDAHLIQYKIPGTPGFFTEEIDSGFLDTIFEFSSCATLGNFLFVAGGYTRSTWCSAADVYRYDPRYHGWAELSPLRTPRVSFALCAASLGLYAVAGINHVVEAGMDREEYLDSVEFYDPHTGGWRYITPLPMACFSVSAVVGGDDTLYVSGGITDDPADTVPVAHMRRYRPGEEQWKYVAPMLKERQGHSMLHHCERIYVHGGYTAGLDTMSFQRCMTNEVYDPEVDQWTRLSDTPAWLQHIHPSSTVFHGVMYFVTGSGPERRLVDVTVNDKDEQEIGEGETCWDHVLRVQPARVAFPFDDLERPDVEEEEEVLLENDD